MNQGETPGGHRGESARPSSADPSGTSAPSAAPRAVGPRHQPPAADDLPRGRFIYRHVEHWVNGRALALTLWVIHNQYRINDAAADSGQLFVSWKGHAMETISGHIKISID